MAYYDGDRRHYQPASDGYARHPNDHPYYYGPMDVVPGRGSNDSFDHDYYPDYYSGYGGHGHGHGYGGYPRHSRVASVHEGSRRPHSYYDGYDYGYGDDDDDDYYRRKPRHSHHRHRSSRYEDDHRGRSSRRHHHSYAPSPTRSSRGKSHHPRSRSEEKLAQAAQAALAAGAIEAFRVRKDPGEWTGDKGKRILTAAVTAGGADGIVDKDPRKHEKRHVVESTLAGLATNHLVNGPRSRSRSRPASHSRSKSHGRGKELATAGLLAAAGKKAYDHYRSRSRSRPARGGSSRSVSRDTESDPSSYDERSPSPRPSRGKKRSKSVSDYINRGISSLGLDDGGKDDRRSRGHHHSSRRRSPSYSDDDYSDDSRDSRSGSDDSRRRYRSPPRSSRYSREVTLPSLSSKDETNTH